MKIALLDLLNPPSIHPAVRFPDRFSQRVYELMHIYNCDHSDGESIAVVEYCELGYIPKPSTYEIPHH
jgi:hypothetical protein